MAQTWRATAKAHRRERYLAAAAALFAARGFNGVSIEELGAAAGVSGPALYRHFPSKEAMLAALLVEASERLVEGATATLAESADPERTLADLIAFHVDFAMAERDVIRVQDRELASLAPEQNRRVRSLQRRYVELWAAEVRRLRPAMPPPEVELRLSAVFGLLNSTPHQRRVGDVPDARGLLAAMAQAALLGGADADERLRTERPGASPAAARSGTGSPR